MFGSCQKSNSSSENTEAQNISVLVNPNQTDNNYSLSDESHSVGCNPPYYATNILLKLTDGYEKVVN